MKRLFLILALCLSAAGCVRNATMVDMASGERLAVKFTDSPGTGGTVTVTMADGEVLSGRYSAVRSGEQLGWSAYGGTYAVTGGQGRAFGLLTSTTPGSTLVMELVAIYGVLDGHGFGDAKTNDGRTFKFQF